MLRYFTQIILYDLKPYKSREFYLIGRCYYLKKDSDYGIIEL